MPGDLSDRAHCEDVVAQTLERFGKLDILVNNAAQQFLDDPLDELSEDRRQRMIASNVTAYIHLTQAALPHLTEGATGRWPLIQRRGARRSRFSAPWPSNWPTGASA